MKTTKVLVAEDYDDARDIMSMVLQSAGFQVLEARDGIEALEAARNFRPNIIVMDMFMPNMDGLTATRALRDEPELRRIPVIAQTAQPSVISGSRELFDAVLAKPCSPDLLIRTITELDRALEKWGQPPFARKRGLPPFQTIVSATSSVEKLDSRHEMRSVPEPRRREFPGMVIFSAPARATASSRQCASPCGRNSATTFAHSGAR